MHTNRQSTDDPPTTTTTTTSKFKNFSIKNCWNSEIKVWRNSYPILLTGTNQYWRWETTDRERGRGLLAIVIQTLSLTPVSGDGNGSGGQRGVVGRPSSHGPIPLTTRDGGGRLLLLLSSAQRSATAAAAAQARTNFREVTKGVGAKWKWPVPPTLSKRNKDTRWFTYVWLVFSSVEDFLASSVTFRQDFKSRPAPWQVYIGQRTTKMATTRCIMGRFPRAPA